MNRYPHGPVLETERLVGEPVAERHRGAAAELFGDPRVAEWIWPGDGGGPRSPEQVDGILARFRMHWEQNGFGWWYLRERSAGRFVGEVGLQRTTIEDVPMVEVGWTLMPDHWGNGYATESARAAIAHAFEQLGMDEIVAYTLPRNRASRRVMERLGMTFDRDIVHAGLPHVLYRLGGPAARRDLRPQYGR